MAEKLAIHGGPKACTAAWPAWPQWDDAHRRALLEVFDSGRWWYGEKVRRFEEAFAAFQGARFGVTATSGSMALEAAILALGLEAGQEVIVPPYTFMATAVAVVRANGVPVFADIEGDTLCLDPADVERKVTERTRGIIPVHLAGYVADMDRLNALARKRGLWVLEDACHAWGSQWRGKGTGALGQAGVFSFQYSKNLTASEGGIVLTDDEALARVTRSYTNCGRVEGKPWYYHETAGTNLRMTEFQAALLLAGLERLPEETARRASNGRLLDEGLGRIPGVRVMRPEPRMTRRAYHLYTFRIDEKTLGVPRDRFIEALSAEGVPATPGYTLPLYRYDVFGREHGRGCRPFAAAGVDYSGVRCPVCEEVCATTVWLKHPMLLAEPEAMGEIVAAVRKVCDGAAALRAKA